MTAAHRPEVLWVRFLLIACASCSDPAFESALPPHAMAGTIDPAWLPDIMQTRGSYVEQACNPRPSEDAAQPCNGATAPRATLPLDCASTFTYAAFRGCCVPYHAITSPEVTDRVYFFECPRR